MHGGRAEGGTDIAGTRSSIHHNTFLARTSGRSFIPRLPRDGVPSIKLFAQRRGDKADRPGRDPRSGSRSRQPYA